MTRAVTGGSTEAAVPASPSNSVQPSISGDPDATLFASPGTWSGNPSPSFAYQWKRDGVSISGATSSTYTTTPADLNTAITVQVTATNSEGSAVATSSAVYPGSLTVDDDTNTVDDDTNTVDQD